MKGKPNLVGVNAPRWRRTRGEHALECAPAGCRGMTRMTESIDNKRSWRGKLFFEEGCDVEDGFRDVSRLLEKLDRFLSQIPGLEAEGIADLRLVCDEIGSNVVRHATPEKPVRLSVEVEVENEIVRMRMEDNGSEFNPFDQAVPYTGDDLEQRRVGGLGLYLIKQLFPLARYQRRKGRNIAEVEYHMGEDGKARMRRRQETMRRIKKV